MGRPLRRLEDPRLVTGADPYVNDVTSTLMDYALPIGSTPAVTNAVLDALAPLGIERPDPPLTPAKVWAAIQGARPDGGADGG